MKQINLSLKYIFAFITDTVIHTYLILISYLIIYDRIIIQNRFPEFQWKILLYCLLAGLCIATLLFFIKNFSYGKYYQKISPPILNKPFYLKPYVLIAALVVVFTIITGIVVTEISIKEFFSKQGIRGAQRIFGEMMNPNFSIIKPALFAAVETIYMAFMATLIAIPFAFILSFFAARNLMNSNGFLLSIYSFVRLIMNFSRSIEALVWAIIFSVWVGIGPFAGMLALMLHSVVSLVKLYSEQIENIDNGPMEAMKATGAHHILVVWYGVVPQIIIPFLSFTIYRWDINVRMATIIGLVGGGGIGTMLIQYQGLAKWREVGLIVLVIAIIVWLMDYASAKIRERIK
ncbi:MAG: phosphonate ABC transporter, permease protein PhnE [Bacteroidales bacterium]